MLAFMFKHYLLICVIIVVMFMIAAGSAVLEAWLDYKGTPKVPMYWCFKHGFFKMEYCLPLFPEMGGTANNSWVCPTCYRETVFINPDKKK